jgi:hypothetical protein
MDLFAGQHIIFIPVRQVLSNNWSLKIDADSFGNPTYNPMTLTEEEIRDIHRNVCVPS